MEVRTIAGHTGAISALAVSGATLISAAADSTVRLWNTANGQAVRTINNAAPATSLAVSRDGQLIAVGGATNAVKLFNAADDHVRPHLGGRGRREQLHVR